MYYRHICDHPTHLDVSLTQKLLLDAILSRKLMSLCLLCSRSCIINTNQHSAPREKTPQALWVSLHVMLRDSPLRPALSNVSHSNTCSLENKLDYFY